METKKSRFKIGVVIVGVLYIIGVIFLTYYAVFIYRDTLPVVTLTTLQSGGINYTYEHGAKLEDGLFVSEWDTREEVFLANIVTPGLAATVHTQSGDVKGEVISCEVPDEFIVRIEIKPDTIPQNADDATVTIVCDHTVEYNFIAPRSAVFEQDGQEFLNAITRTDGPWGGQYVITRQRVLSWPKTGSDEVVIMGINDTVLPVAKNADPSLSEGQEVTIRAEGIE